LAELIQDGGNFSEEKENSSSMFKTKKCLMSKEGEMLKVKLFGSGEETMVHIKGGRLFMKMRKR
jgi:hypothetical protein